MMKLDYHVSSRIWLHMEDYHNNGLSSEKCKEAIERIRDYNDLNLRCDPMGLNGNWIVLTCATHPEDIADIVFIIRCVLNRLVDAIPKELRKPVHDE